jgi:hypothetical protein
MGRIRKMPSRKQIFNYWSDKLDKAVDDNTCFKCQHTDEEHTAVERAHILAVCDGGTDECSNIHLLCSECHNNSEPYNGELYDDWLNIKDDFNFKIGMIVKWYDGKKNYIHKDLEKQFQIHTDNYINKNGKVAFDDYLILLRKSIKE